MGIVKVRTYHHAATHLRYHIIFSTKYRAKCLEGIEDSLGQAFRYAEKHSDFKIIEMGFDKDHAHLVVTFKPRLSISQVVNRMKHLSTWKIWQLESDHLKQFYWKGKRVLWTGGYFCSTVGYAEEDKVINYVKNQGS